MRLLTAIAVNLFELAKFAAIGAALYFGFILLILAEAFLFPAMFLWISYRHLFG
jgi:hypothetical protein